MKYKLLLYFDWWKDQASNANQYERRLSFYKFLKKLLKRK